MKTVIDLFSGIGGFALGLESTGYFKTVQFVENETWCQKILNKNFPEVPIHDDVKTFKGYGADVVVGGFPCQPFSVAGKQKAIQDDRHLWPDMFRVIKETKPTWVIGENVRNIISISGGMVFEQVYLDLESEGYEVQSFIIPASAVNAPHQRYRTWIVAYSECNEHRQKIRRSYKETSKVQKEHRQNDNQSWQSSGTSSIRFSDQRYDDVENTRRSSRRGKSTRNKESIGPGSPQQTQWTSDSNKVRGSSERTETMAHTDSQRGGLWETDRQNAEDVGQSPRCKVTGNWDFEPNVGRVANGIPNRVDRLRGLGNAIVPQIAYQIGKAIMEAENDNR